MTNSTNAPSSAAMASGHRETGQVMPNAVAQVAVS